MPQRGVFVSFVVPKKAPGFCRLTTRNIFRGELFPREIWATSPSEAKSCQKCPHALSASSERPSLKTERPSCIEGARILEMLWKLLNYKIWGFPAVLSRGIPGNALRAFPGSFQNFSGISSGKSQPLLVLGHYANKSNPSNKEPCLYQTQTPCEKEGLQEKSPNNESLKTLQVTANFGSPPSVEIH